MNTEVKVIVPLSKVTQINTFFFIFCCKAARPIEAKSHVALLWFVRMKVSKSCPGHVTKMATMPIYGENL